MSIIEVGDYKHEKVLQFFIYKTDEDYDDILLFLSLFFYFYLIFLVLIYVYIFW